MTRPAIIPLVELKAGLAKLLEQVTAAANEAAAEAAGCCPECGAPVDFCSEAPVCCAPGSFTLTLSGVESAAAVERIAAALERIAAAAERRLNLEAAAALERAATTKRPR